MMSMPLLSAGVINGIGHYWGYRNYECEDAARNIVPFGLFIGGEELHNNHHTFASSAKFSLKKWEVDIGWLYIRALSFLRLARIKKLPPEFKLVPEKMHIDADTVKVLLANRFQVLSRYSKEVLLPVLKHEKKVASVASRKALRRINKVLIRDHSLVNATQRARLTKALEESDALEKVYQFRLRLQAIWSRTAANQKECLEALKEWCHQAEETGIEVLQEFAARLRMYVPQPV